MIRGVSYAERTAELTILEQRKTAENYLSTLATFMLPYAFAFHGKKIKFTHDAASNNLTGICI